MKKTPRYILGGIVILLILGVVGFYVYDVTVLDTPYMENLFRAIVAVCLLFGALIRLQNKQSRKSLAIYEKAYEEQLQGAFRDKPLLRKKLLCACRLYDECNYRKALKYLYQLLKAAEQKEDMCSVLLFIALCFTDARVPQEAIKIYSELLRIDPYNAQVHNNLGLLYIATGKFEEAREHYDNAIRYKPDYYHGYINRAYYYFRVNEYDNAVSDAKQALNIKNNGAEAATLLTIIYALQGDEEKKKKYYHIAISSGKKPEDLNAAIQHYLTENEESTEEDEEE